MKDISSKLFRVNKLNKARKIYHRIYESFKNRESAKNFHKEDETTKEFKEARKILNEQEMTSMTNLALVYLKEKKYDQCIDVCDRALEVDNTIHKAYFYKGKALTEKTDYQKAIDVLK